MIAKNYPAPQVWAYLPLIALYDAAATLYALFARRDGSPLAGRITALAPVAGGVRQTTDHTRRVSGSDLMWWLKPLDPPWKVLGRYQHLRAASR